MWSSPADDLERVGPLPDNVGLAKGPAEAATALLFVDDEASLQKALAAHGEDLHGPDVVWIAYPKGGLSDINRNSVPKHLTEHSMRPIGQVSIDETWSALRFRPLKPGEASFKGGAR